MRTFFKFTNYRSSRGPFNSWQVAGRAGRAEKEGGYHSSLQPQSLCDSICQNQDYEGFCLWNADSPAVRLYMYYFTVGLTIPIRVRNRDGEVTSRSWGILRSLSDQVSNLKTNTLNQLHAHIIYYHYQIIAWSISRFEEGMTLVFDQITSLHKKRRQSKIYVSVLIMNLKALCKEEEMAKLIFMGTPDFQRRF